MYHMLVSRNSRHGARIFFVLLMVVLFTGGAVFYGFGKTEEKDMVDTSVVPGVDLQRYAGVWYEIARFPHSFEKDLVGVTATYTVGEDGRIWVLNQGYRGSFEGRIRKTRARATIPDPRRPGSLKVFFFLFIGAEYNIMMLDDDYQYALVGSSTPNFLWILSRTPHMDSDIYGMLVAEAQRRGYDVNRLQLVPQR